MAIAFRPPEIRSEGAAVAPAAVHPSHPGMYQATTSVSASSPPPPLAQPYVQHSPQFGVTVQGPTGGYVILSPSSAVMQHQGLWLSSSPQQQQQMFSGGFPPIYHNNTATPQQQPRVVPYAVTNASPPQMRHPSRAPQQQQRVVQQNQHQSHLCVTLTGTTTTTAGCATCNDIRRGK